MVNRILLTGGLLVSLISSAVASSESFAYDSFEKDALVISHSLNKEKDTEITTGALNIAPVFNIFNGKIANGLSIGLSIEDYNINFTKVSGDFDKRELTIDTPYNIFIKNLSVKTTSTSSTLLLNTNSNSINETNNFIGISYRKYLNNQDDDFFDSKEEKNVELNYFTFKAGISINNNNPYYIGLSYNYVKKMRDRLNGYGELSFDKYEFGTDASIKFGISYEF